jgi:hypothetical protein
MAADFRQQEETLHRQEQEMTDLLKINVNEHTEKKGTLTYLSWAWAWAEVLKIDPRATWCVHQYGPQGSEQPCMWIGETAMVHTSVTINGIRRECMLPVMDHKNNAMKNPDARKVSDSIMRCMTKAISMHGLGLYIYAGEDLPEGDETTQEPRRKENGRLPGVGVHKGTDGMLEALPEDMQLDIRLVASVLPGIFEKQGIEAAFDKIESKQYENDEKVALWGLLDSKIRSALKREGEKRHIAARNPAIEAGLPAH